MARPRGTTGTPKTGGRKAGTPNKSTEAARKHVQQVCAQLKRWKKPTLAEISVALLTCGIQPVIQRELQCLRELIYTKPKQAVEVSGKDGAPVPLQVIWDIPAGIRATK